MLGGLACRQGGRDGHLHGFASVTDHHEGMTEGGDDWAVLAQRTETDSCRTNHMSDTSKYRVGRPNLHVTGSCGRNSCSRPQQGLQGLCYSHGSHGVATPFGGALIHTAGSLCTTPLLQVKTFCDGLVALAQALCATLTPTKHVKASNMCLLA